MPHLTGATISALYAYSVPLLLVIVSSFATVRNQQEKEAVRSGTDVVAITRNWSIGKPSTPGAHVKIVEVKRIEEHGKLLVKYHYFLTGVAKDQIYGSFDWPVNAAEPQQTMQGLTLGPDGLVICAGRIKEQCGSPDKKDDPVEFSFLPIKGEMYREALISADGNTKVFFVVTPDPIIGRDKNCTLEAIRIQPRFETAMIWGKGFKSNESLLLTGKSYDEAHETQAKADENGEFVMALLPFVKGRQSGKTELKLRGVTCSPSVSFEWGK
jgi:hypothetical protein